MVTKNGGQGSTSGCAHAIAPEPSTSQARPNLASLQDETVKALCSITCGSFCTIKSAICSPEPWIDPPVPCASITLSLCIYSTHSIEPHYPNMRASIVFVLTLATSVLGAIIEDRASQADCSQYGTYTPYTGPCEATSKTTRPQYL